MKLQIEKPITTIYDSIRSILENSRKRVIQNVNFEMVQAYWKIGEIIVEEEQQGKTRAEYGVFLIKELSKKLAEEFGKGFTEGSLKRMRLFYKSFPIGAAVRHLLEEGKEHDESDAELRTELSWTHYRSLIKVKNNKARYWYMNEAVDNGWSTRAIKN